MAPLRAVRPLEPVGVRGRIVEREVGRVEVVHADILQPDRPAALRGEVDHRVVAVGGDAQIPEAGHAGEADGIDPDGVLAVGEVLDGVGPVRRNAPAPMR